MMRKYSHILLAFALAFAACSPLNEPEMTLEKAPEGAKVKLAFKVAVPNDGQATKSMGNTPSIDPDGFYVAVFGGSGYFNEWVKATVEEATTNYPSTSTVYTISANLSVSESRLRVHFIANCPKSVRTSPPISGSADTEEYVLSRVRSQLTEEYNDGYWQKVILPNGVKADKVGDEYVATAATLAQFPDPIVMVRNFARVYLRNLTPIVGQSGSGHQLVTIKKFGLAYAPSEGVIAPILSAPYASNVVGEPITVPDDDSDTTPVYYENFFINYQNYPIDSTDPDETLITGDPFNYGGYSPADQAYNYYTGAGHSDPGAPLESDLKAWDNENPENNVLYVYERTIPSASRRATRLLIKAERVDQNGVSEGDKFYALDIVNSEGVAIPLLRNQSYTVHLLNIEDGSGEDDITQASTATSASVTGDPNFQGLINISDGKSSIGTSFTEKFYVQPQLDSVMFRYIPTNISDENYDANKEGNELVTVSIGSYNTETGIFTELTPAQASSQGVLCFNTEGGNYRVWISKDGDDVIQYVRSNNKWVEATQDQIDNHPEIEKWGMIKFELSDSYAGADGYFSEERLMSIHVVGKYSDRELNRNVIIKTSPRQEMIVTCQQKFVAKSAGEEEVVRILIPAGLSRSVFPLDFTIEPDGYSLTPNGDELPVSYGTSTVPGVSTPAFYYVKSLTQEAYNALETIQRNGRTWKVVDCHFKTTVADNACRVYVNNRYFMDDSASDEFYNYLQRQFTWDTVPTTVYRHGNTTFEFTLDYAHRTDTHVWWDPENNMEAGLSETNRVLPKFFLVTLTGLTPQYQEDGETPVSVELEHYSGNSYLFYVGDVNSNPTSTDANQRAIALTATGAVGSTASVTLSTANLDNPDLYATATTSLTIRGAEFIDVGYNGTYVGAGIGKTAIFHFTYVDGIVIPATLAFDGFTLDGTGQNNNLVRDNGNGTYTLTPTDLTQRTYNIALKTTTRFSSATVYLSAEDYSGVNATLPRQGITFTTTNAATNFGGSRTKTIEDVTVEFSNGATISGSYTTAANNTDITISAPSGCHLTRVEIHYTSNTYRASNVTVRSGGGTYSYSSPTGTWTASGSSTTNVTLRTTKRNNYNTQIASIVVYLADD